MEKKWEMDGISMGYEWSSHGSIDGILLGSYLNIFEQQWEMDEVSMLFSLDIDEG